MKALDVASDTTGHAHDIAALGYAAVGLYLRGDRSSAAMVDGLHEVGLRVWSIWETGEPTSIDYFSSARGASDGAAAAAFALAIGQPAGSPIFATFDYDAADDDIHGACLDYMTAFRTAIGLDGYRAGAYGNGDLLTAFSNLGFISKGYLAGSRGFSGFTDWEDRAAIVQGAEAHVLGFDVDFCDVNDAGVLW